MYKKLILLNMLMLASSLANSRQLEDGFIPLEQVFKATNPAEQLTEWYNNTTASCGADTRPAFLCSGVTLRITSVNPKYLAWDPSPGSIKKGGISFSWLRADDNFTRFVFDEGNGMIFYPSDEIPAGKLTNIETLCVYPTDGATDNRPTEQGCGPNIYFPSQSVACEKQNITTADQWIAHYNQNPNYNYQCSWNVRPNEPSNNNQFQQYLATRAKIQATSKREYNEFMLSTWATGSGATMPIQSFFYVSGSTANLNYARINQQKYYDLYHQFIPVIKLTLPDSQNFKSTFSYSDSDQIVKIRPVATLNPLTPQATGNNGTLLTKANYYSLKSLSVQVPQYEGMKSGDIVSIVWQGRDHIFIPEAQTVRTPGTITFDIPRAEFIDTIGQTAMLSFSVTHPDNVKEQSAILSLAIEGQSLTLGSPDISDDYRTATVSYSGMKSTDTIQLRWQGITTHDTESTSGSSKGSVNFAIPAEWVNENKGREVLANYTVRTSSNAQLQFSQYQRVTIRNEIRDLKPIALEASGENGSLLKQSDYYALQSLTVQVPEYSDMAIGDSVRVAWKGRANDYLSEPVTVDQPRALTFQIPRAEFIDTIGNNATLMFVVQRSNSAGTETSAPLTLAIEGQTLSLSAPTVSGDYRSVTASYSGMSSSDSVAVSWQGVNTHVTGAVPGNADGSVTFIIPASWVRENQGQQVLINYTVQTATGGQYQFSQLLRVKIEDSSNTEIPNLQPRAVEATGNNGSLLKQTDYYALENLTVEVPAWRGMAAGDKVSVRWEGRAENYVTPVQTVTKPGTLLFQIPRAEFIDTIGSNATLSFGVERIGGGAIENSGRKTLAVERQTLVLPAPEVSGDARTVTVSYSGMKENDNITVRWQGVSTRDTSPVSGNADGSVLFIIPSSWVKENLGHEVLVNFQVQTASGAQYQFSQIKRITPMRNE